MVSADGRAVPPGHRSDFRTDINGLRALAICLVVAFLACPTLLRGGFVGVDVFFVVSGYLISGIVLRGLQAGSFEFLVFYGRRAVRILPALLVVLAATSAFGWISLYSFEFASLGQQSVAALGFASNLLLWSESGYFDVSALQKPLLHLWSLAIEEQFYLLFPLTMWVAHRGRMNPKHVILGLLLLSFALNIEESSRDPVGDFFNPATRTWEILVGALLAVHAVPVRYPHAMSVCGGLLILGSAVAFNDALRFPGWYALLPTSGTALLILAGPASLVGGWLSSRKVGWLGLISYPLYLWHWPILSFVALLQPAGARGVVTALAMAGALALAALTFVAIERPIAAIRWRRLRQGVIALPFAMLALLGFTAYAGAGYPERAVSLEAPLDGDMAEGAKLAAGIVQQGCDVPVSLQAIYAHCQHDARGRARFALLGDSKAASLAPGLFDRDVKGDYWLFVGGYMRDGSTPVPVLSDAPEFHTHQASLRPALAAISADSAVRVVVLATATRSLFRLPEADSIAGLAGSGEYPQALEGLDRSVSVLLNAGKKVVLLVDNPTFRAPPLCVSRTTSVRWIDRLLNLEAGTSSCEISRSDQLKVSARYRALLDAVVARHPGQVFLFDSLDVLCDPVTTVCSAMDGPHHLYSYSDHISAFAARRIAQRLVPFVRVIAGSD
ncbi:MAG: acyltransferase [Caulobacter sp.]|nr:acyltransferase [Vitreoscilla sp.]